MEKGFGWAVTSSPGAPKPKEELLDFFPSWNLARNEKGFHQLSFTANDHTGKPFEPFSLRNLRLRVEPINHQCELLPGNVTLLNALEQMSVQLPGQIAPQDFWHASLAVKSARHGGL